MKDPKNNKNDTELKEYRNKLNSRWIIGILVFLVMCFATVILCDNYLFIKQELRFLEILATMLSIVLSFIAIFYSYSTSNESSRQWGLISNAMASTNASLNNITSLHKQMQKDLGNIHTHMTTLDYSVNAFRQKGVPNKVMPNYQVDN